MDYAVALLTRGIDSRSRTDRRLFFLMDGIILPLITLGIWGVVLQYRLINRRDEHFRRENMLNHDLVEAIRQRVRAKGYDPLALPQMASLESTVREKDGREQTKGAALWLILSIVTGGIAGIYVSYFLTVDFFHHEQRQLEVFRLANEVLLAVGAGSAFGYEEVLPERHFWLNLLASFATLGFWGIVWQYRMLSDPNRHFEGQWPLEDGYPSVIAAI